MIFSTDIAAAGNKRSPAAITKKKKKIKWKRIIPIYLIMLPGVAYLIINNILPLYGITIAFREPDFSVGILNSPWIGFENFKTLFSSGIIGPMLLRTISYNVVFLVLGIVFPVSVSILFSTIRSKMSKRLFQTIILFPNIISYVIVAFMAYGFLGAEGFINNSLLIPFTGKSIDFYSSPKYWPFILTFVNMWKTIGFSMVVYLAAIVGIDPGLYEAAKIDGAGWWRRTTNITLPSIRKMIVTMFILSLSKIMVSDFGLFYHVTQNQGLLYETTQTMDVYVYNKLIRNPDFTTSSAVSVFQSIIGFVLIIVSNLIVRKIDRESAMF